MKITQISVAVEDGRHYLYVLLEDGRIFRRQRSGFLSVGEYEWVEVSTARLFSVVTHA